MENLEMEHRKEKVGDSEASIRQDFLDMPLQGFRGDGLDEMDNGFVMSQSEIIDFSQGVDGVDPRMEGNL